MSSLLPNPCAFLPRVRSRPFAPWLVVAAIVAASAGWGSPREQTPEATHVTIDGKDALEVGFDTLADFSYEIHDVASGATPEQMAAATTHDQIPAWIRSYHDRRVALRGYMLPLEVEGGRTTRFIMMRTTMTCCYGAVPNMNEYVVVTMSTGGVVPVQDVPVVIVGTFKVNEIYEGGYLTSIFQMDGEKFLGAENQ